MLQETMYLGSDGSSYFSLDDHSLQLNVNMLHMEY